LYVASAAVSKTQKGRFTSKTALHLKEVYAIQNFLVCDSLQRQIVRHSLAYLSVQKWFAGDVSYDVKI